MFTRVCFNSVVPTPAHGSREAAFLSCGSGISHFYLLSQRTLWTESRQRDFLLKSERIESGGRYENEPFIQPDAA